jgi:hypothetical protein
MAEYERVLVRCLASVNSDYSAPKADTRTQEVNSTPEYVSRCGDCPCPVGGFEAMAASEFATGVDTVFIKNNGSSSVLVTYKDTLGTTIMHSISAGNMFLTQDVIRTNAVTVASGAGVVECFIYVSGS